MFLCGWGLNNGFKDWVMEQVSLKLTLHSLDSPELKGFLGGEGFFKVSWWNLVPHD